MIPEENLGDILQQVAGDAGIPEETGIPLDQESEIQEVDERRVEALSRFEPEIAQKLQDFKTKSISVEELVDGLRGIADEIQKTQEAEPEQITGQTLQEEEVIL